MGRLPKLAGCHMDYRTVLFDLDGTLVDAFRTIHRSYSHVLPKFGYPAPTMEQVRRAVGGGLADAVRQFVPAELVPPVLAAHQAYSQEILLEDVVLLPGAGELLGALRERGVICAVFTNKYGPSARRICDHLGISPKLQGTFGATDTAWLKPQPEFAAHVFAELGAEAASTCLVGDSPFDVKAACQSGCAFVGVVTGTHARAELQAAGAEVVMDDLPGLSRLWGLR